MGSIWNSRRTVLAEHRAIFDREFPKFNKGVFFFYFSSLDLNSHMFWRLIDPHHPEYDADLAAKYGSALPEFYEQIDQVLGEVMPGWMTGLLAGVVRPRLCALQPVVQSEYVVGEQWLCHFEKRPDPIRMRRLPMWTGAILAPTAWG